MGSQEASHSHGEKSLFRERWYILDSLIDVAFGCPLGALHEENRALVYMVRLILFT